MKPKNGFTLILAAANEFPIPRLSNSLDAGADVNIRTVEKSTPLMYAARWNQNPEVIKALLKAGADGKARSCAGKTAFDYAEMNEHIKDTEVYWLLNDAQSMAISVSALGKKSF